ncbi:MAG: YkgJ family cysteine cluster protein [Treponema sp.]|jgi:Fe-S-cluster containining protein|nr:YkgJ family cysteine cluster protein [Treponema sp.]
MEKSKGTSGLPSGSQDSFYARGLRFSCTRCSACCRYESGYVFLSLKDLGVLVKALNMGYTEFMETYCRWVPSLAGPERLSLREKSNFDCIFWVQPQEGTGGCSVYEARPLQCRAFPFWPHVLRSQRAWKDTAADCPGMGQGRLYTAEAIEAWLEQQQGEAVIIRETEGPREGD